MDTDMYKRKCADLRRLTWSNLGQYEHKIES